MRATTVRPGQLVELAGRLDGTGAATARAALHGALADGEDELVIDLRDLELIDATGLGVLVGSHRRAGLIGRRLVLRDPPARVARILMLTRLDRILVLERTAVTAR